MNVFLSEQDHDMKLLVHEIRNPLSAIDAGTQLIMQILHGEKTIATPELNKIVDMISRNTARIQCLLRDTFQVEAISPEAYTNHEICPIIDAALDNVRDRLQMGHVRVSRHYEPGHPIRCHKEKLLLAFSNIITNAVEAMEADGGSLSIYVIPDGDNLQVRIQDNGSGLSDGVAERLFQGNFSSKPRGLGLGLTLVKEIIDNHEGSIQLFSKDHKGTTVLLRFPLN